MADSLRQKLVDALLARLRTILVSGGYETNLGRNVMEWRNLETNPWKETDFIAEADQSAINVKDKSEPGDNSTIQGRHLKTLQFELELATNKAVVSASDATLSVAHQLRKLLADVEKSLQGYQGVSAWITTPRIHIISAISVSDIHVSEVGNVLGYAAMAFSMEYTTRPSDPYNQ